VLEAVGAGALRQRPFAIRFWDGSEVPATLEVSGGAPVIVLRDPAVIADLLREPNDLGLGRAWVAGRLEIEGDLDAVVGLRRSYYGVSFSARDRALAARIAWRVAGRSAFRRPPPLESEIALSGRRHSLRRDREAVRHHYDVPDAFYRHVLGPSMVYSCAYFETSDDSLEAAQERKLELICRKLRLRPGDRLLDIGCGWGSLILHAAANHGVRAVGVTLSPSQAEVARRRIAAAGFDGVAEVRVADYRELTDGGFDAVASVGMYEHVAARDYGAYAGTVARLLTPGGRFLNHGIAHIKPGPDHDRTFMRRFVFPDAELKPLTQILRAFEEAGLELRDVESLREHYGLTLRRWLANLEGNRDAAIRAGGRERERVWRLYMTGAANAFETGEITVHQSLVVRPGAGHRLPLTRAWLTSAASAISANGRAGHARVNGRRRVATPSADAPTAGDAGRAHTPPPVP
jgi:cyclopropane-fatty-acyl-phospholipid synthase